MATNDQPNGILLTLVRYTLNIAAIVGGLVLTAGLFFILVTRATPKPAAQAGEAPASQAQAAPTATMPAPTAEPTELPAEAPASAAAGPEVIAMGEELFTSQGCVGCHTIEGVSQGAVGPDLTDIGDEAEERAQEAGVVDAATYVREAIVDPNAFVAPECPTGPCPPGVMPQNFGAALSEAQVDALVHYLLAQKGG
ncbi:MAG: c-type cytochrome [Anaerolineae bacterium]